MPRLLRARLTPRVVKERPPRSAQPGLVSLVGSAAPGQVAIPRPPTQVAAQPHFAKMQCTILQHKMQDFGLLAVCRSDTLPLQIASVADTSVSIRVWLGLVGCA